MIGRLFSCALVAAFAFTAAPAWAQVSSPASSATAGSSCTGAPANGSSSFFLWPDTSGHILQCNGTTWVTATEPAGAAGSTGYVQYNNGGALAGTANLFWNNSSGYLSIGTTNDLVFDNVSSARPLVVQTASTATTVGSGTNSIAIVNSDTTTNNTSSLIFADITGASTNQYADAAIVAVHGARTNTDYNSGQLAFMTAPGGNIAPAERVRIDNNGNVGIGTTGPASLLHLESALGGSTATVLIDNDDNATSADQLAVRGHSNTNQNLLIGYNTASDYGSIQAVKLGTAFEPLILNGQGGNVGIGTTTPKSLLDVSSAAFGTYAGVTAAPANDVIVGGSVGIGNASPAVPLDVEANSSAYGIRLRSNTTPGSYWLDIEQSDGNTTLASTNSDLDFSNNFRMYFTTGGGGWSGAYSFAVASPMTYAGTPGYYSPFIGAAVTWAPTSGSGGFAGLSLAPTINQTGSASGNYTGLLVNVTETAFLGTDGRLLDVQKNGASQFVVKDTGNVGIGTTVPNGTLDVRPGANENILVRGPEALGSGASIYSVNDANSALGPLEIAASTMMLNTTAVGIGTTVPNYALDVWGGGAIHAQAGFETQAGNNAGAGGHVFNLNWTGGVTQLWIDYSNAGTISVSSDRRIKKNIQPLRPQDGLAAISRLNPVSFNWKDKESGSETQFGLIAQEVHETFPNLVRNTGLKTAYTPDGLLHLEYNGLIAPVIKSIQELKALFDGDHEEIAKLKADNDNLKAANSYEAAQIKALAARLDAIEATQTSKGR
jgi:hypothetical protein